MARLESPARSEQIDSKLEHEPWQQVASFCAYCCTNLRLRPWQSPPVWLDPDEIESTLAGGDDGAAGDFAAALLLKRMLAAKLSQFEPDPLAALKRVKARPTDRPPSLSA
jgi:hypothetical protein